MKNPETAWSVTKSPRKKPLISKKDSPVHFQNKTKSWTILEILSSHGLLLWRIGVSIVILMTLFVGLILMEKLNHLQEQKLLEYWGATNAEHLQQLYQNPYYADYFKNEIELLEKRVQQFAKTVSK